MTARKTRRTKTGERPEEWEIQKVYWMGRSYDIPIGKNGYVPLEAMVMRYQEMGNSSRDRRRDSQVIYPQNAKPSEIVRWWADPSSCDIDGIDTRNSRVYDLTGVKGKEMRRVQQRIGIVTPSPKEQRRIRKIISEAFTAEELDRMTAGQSVVIRTVSDGGKALGYYIMRRDGVKVPLISLEEGVGSDTVIHEMVHHARTTRPPGRTTSTAYPQKSDGSFDAKRYDRLSEKDKHRLHDAEETATTAEATARGHLDPNPTGYWDNVGGMEAYKRDRARLSSACGGKDCTLKGVAAVNTVERKYNNLEIAMARILADVPAKESVETAKKMNTKSQSTKKSSASGKKPAKKASQSPTKTKNTASTKRK